MQVGTMTKPNLENVYPNQNIGNTDIYYRDHFTNDVRQQSAKDPVTVITY